MRKTYFLTVLSFFIITISIFALNKIDFINDEKTILETENHTVAVLLPPAATISGSTDVCRNDTEPQITFTGSGGTAPYTFTYTINGANQTDVSSNMNDDSVSIPVPTNTVGTFVYELISVEDADSETSNTTNETATIKVGELIINFDFDNDNACSGTNITFTSSANGTGGYNYDWDFGDGQSSTDSNPVHQFEALGCGSQNFNVKLTVTDDYGCSKTITKVVSVKQKPDIDFKDFNFSNPAQFFNNCANSSSNPIYTLTVENISNSNCTAYNIDWGDGNSESFDNSTIDHTYTEAKSFEMIITGIGSNGCTSEKRFIVKNSTNPQGNIVSPGTTQNICAPSEVAFTISSNWGANSIDTRYEVDFGDGSPIAIFYQDEMQTDLGGFYNATDPKNSLPFPTPHTYNTSNCPNDFVATILIRNSCGDTPGLSGGVRILKNAEPDFDHPKTVCTNQPIEFINTSSGSSAFDCSEFVEFKWDFGDGSPIVTTFGYQSVIHTYLAPKKDYSVKLFANNGECAETMIEKSICIEPQLAPAFTLNTNNGCSPLAIQTTNTTDLSESCGGDTYLWEVTYSSGFCGTAPENWSFTNGTDENSAAPSMSFDTAGTYALTLTTTNSCGSNSISETIEVKQPPIVTVNAISDFCGSASFNPVATVNSCAPSSETITYSWTFPGGTPATASTLDPGTITYATSGNYDVTFSVTNNCGTATDTKSFSVNPVPSITNTDISQTLCSGGNTQEITFTSDIANTTYSWVTTSPNNITGAISSGTGTSIPIHALSLTSGSQADVTYKVTPILNNCSGTPITFTITVNEGPSIATQPTGSDICLDGTPNTLEFVLGGNPTGTVSYQWYFNDNGNNNPTASTMVAAPEGQQIQYIPPTDNVGTIHYFAVISFSGTGSCSEIKTNAVPVTINANIKITNNSPLNQTLCTGSTAINLTVTTDNAGAGTTAYQWYQSTDNMVDNSDTTIGTNSKIYSPGIINTAGTYYYYLVIDSDDSRNCSDVISDVFTITVNDDPQVNIPQADQTICTNASAETLTTTASGGIDTNNDGNIDSSDYQFQWYDANGAIAGETNDTFTPPSISAGTYQYYVILTQPNVQNCEGTSNTVTINVNQGPSIAAQPIGTDICIDGTPNILEFTLGGNPTGTISYQWYFNKIGNNDAAASTAVASPEGQQAQYAPPTDSLGTLYYFCVISFSGTGSCNEIKTTPVAVIINPNITITNNSPLNQTICVGASAEELTITTDSGSTGNVIYKWYQSLDNIVDNTDTPIGSNSTTYSAGTLNTSGTYYYYVVIDADQNLNCLDMTSQIFAIVVNNDPVVTVAPTNQTICQNVTPETLVATATGGMDINTDGNTDNDDYEFQWHDSNGPIANATNTTFTPPTNTVGTFDYYVVISQPNTLNCDGTSNSSSVKVNIGPSITSQPLSQEICLDEPLQTLEAPIANGVGSPTYEWYSNDTNDMVTPTLVGTNPTFSPPDNTVGTFYYYVIITFPDGGCGSLTSNITEITINQTPRVGNKSNTICSGNAFTISPDNSGGDTVTAGTTYTWTNPIINPVGSITGASIATTPQNNISQTLINNTTNPSTVTYTVTPTSGICVGNDFEVTITVNPSISITENVINSDCYLANTGSIDLSITGGVPFPTGNPYNPYQISWTGPNGYTNTNEDISNLAPGDYTVTINDDGGCPFTSTFTITEPNELIFSTIDFDPETISCFGANDGTIGIEISGGTTPYSYNWTRNGAAFATTEDLSNLGSGDYEMTVTDINNCTPIIESFSIMEPTELIANLSNQVNIICFGDATGEINVTISGGRLIETSPGVFDYSYAWTGPNGFISNLQNLTGLFAGTYNLTVTDKSNCTDTLEVILIQTDEIIIDYTATEIECYGYNDASITINTISGGNPPYTIAWSNFGSGMVQTNLSAGTYVITVTDNTNCVKQATVVIDEAPIFTITPAVNNVSCFGESDARIVLNLVGGIAPVTVVWDDDPSAGVERNNIDPGTYTVTITDGTPCVITETFTITQPDELALSANTTDALDCDDANSGAINLIVTGGTLPLTYSWSNGATTEDLNAIPPGNYLVTLTDANNCQIDGDWTIKRFEPLEVNINTITDFDCDAKTVEQSFVAQVSGGVPPYNINWSSGTVSGANGEIMDTNQNGLVIIDVSDSLGCTTNFSYNVDIPVLGDADFSTTSNAFSTFGFYSVQDPIQFTNTATGDYISVSWDFGNGNFSAEENPTHTYINEGSYIVTQTATYPFGCVYTKQITLIIEKGYSIIMPNAFTPNGDGMNAYFAPESIALSDITLNIYDTWGSLIYSEKGDNIKGWDGKINDAEAENGNYYYTLEAKTFYDGTITRKGVFVSIK